jgi:hypothetical protein
MFTLRLNAERGTSLAATIAALLLIGACSSNTATSALPAAVDAAGPLISSIVKGVPGLTQAQAVLGAGAVLGHAKAKMAPDQFAKVAEAVPGTNQLVDAATKQGLPNNAANLEEVKSFLDRNGLSASQVEQLVPVVGNTVAKSLPADVGSAFQASLR